jgi:metal iron transporter
MAAYIPVRDPLIYLPGIAVVLILVFAAVGIIGATVMPHGLFVGCALATQDRVSEKPAVLPCTPGHRATRLKGLPERFLNLFRLVQIDTQDEFASHADRPNSSLSFVKAHLRHAMVDIIVNLLGIAVIINSL